ncbi:MAG: TIGR00341 family protein [Bacteroidales bacterium]|jgi:uncharacterized hydrophobic protein (TIGR00271 family)|nr:TIGR00341 family protein [Bacteroidales bacterium]
MEHENNQRNIFRFIRLKIRHLVQLNEDTDIEATIASITKSVEFRGVNIWILAFAIVVASVGLNVNSTAVIIGAMLISPLMGPINGIGLALGISDTELLRKAATNLLIMVFISLFFSTAYFIISPLSDAQSELLARTTPTIYDVMIAVFGGLAGIVALSRKEQPFTVISGVAIATALMPPLCTAGFGLATLQWNYFFGAFYLFFINSVCIALATYIVVKYLNFPPKKYLDPRQKKIQKHTISFIFVIIIVVPSIFMGANVIREISFHSQITKFVSELQKSELFQERQLINAQREYHRTSQQLTITIVGTSLSTQQVSYMQNKLHKDYNLPHAELVVKQSSGAMDTNANSELLENLFDKKEQQLLQKDSVIDALHYEIQNRNKTTAEMSQIAKEIAVQYPDVNTISIAYLDYMNTKTLNINRIPTVYVAWNSNPSTEQRAQLLHWLKVRLNVSELKLIE